MGSITKEIAIAEITKWLDFKKVNTNKRVANFEIIERLVGAMCDGELVLMDDFVLSQVLKFPIEDTEGKTVLNELKFKPRIKTETLHLHLQGVKADNVDGRILAHIAAVTGNPKNLIGKLDTEDMGLSQSIVTFFFPS